MKLLKRIGYIEYVEHSFLPLPYLLGEKDLGKNAAL